MNGQAIVVTISLENGVPVIPASQKRILVTQNDQLIRWQFDHKVPNKWRIASIPFTVPPEWVNQFPEVAVPGNRRSVTVKDRNTVEGLISYDVYVESPKGGTFPIDPELHNDPPPVDDDGDDDDDDDDDD